MKKVLVVMLAFVCLASLVWVGMSLVTGSSAVAQETAQRWEYLVVTNAANPQTGFLGGIYYLLSNDPQTTLNSNGQSGWCQRRFRFDPSSPVCD
jgi:hypothetical protein